MKEISAKAHGDGYMSFSSNFWLDFVTVWGVIRLNLEPTQKADCISRIFIPKIDSPGLVWIFLDDFTLLLYHKVCADLSFLCRLQYMMDVNCGMFLRSMLRGIGCVRFPFSVTCISPPETE